LFPGALKVLGRNIAHKTQLGGVVLNIRSVEDARWPSPRIKGSVPRHDPQIGM
jgi:acyl-CoA synthetase (NDP forming)